jgi:hypothetical protein
MEYMRTNGTLLILGMGIALAALLWYTYSNMTAISVGKRVVDSVRTALTQSGCFIEGEKVRCLSGPVLEGLGLEFSIKDASMKAADAVHNIMLGGGSQPQQPPMPPPSPSSMGGGGSENMMPPPREIPGGDNQGPSLGNGDTISGGLLTGASGF